MRCADYMGAVAEPFACSAHVAPMHMQHNMCMRPGAVNRRRAFHVWGTRACAGQVHMCHAMLAQMFLCHVGSGLPVGMRSLEWFSNVAAPMSACAASGLQSVPGLSNKSGVGLSRPHSVVDVYLPGVKNRSVMGRLAAYVLHARLEGVSARPARHLVTARPPL
eukprot:360793-Chlamydomonas_euryale.AAC.6